MMFSLLFFVPNYASSNPIKFEIWNNFDSKKTFLIDNYPNNSSGLNISQDNSAFSYNFSLNHLNNKTLSLDQTNLEYKFPNLLFGVGKINRNWSFIF